jgi:hypothetical protein
MMLSVPHHGQATVNRPTMVLEATTGVFIADLAFLRPSDNYLRRAQTRPIHASLARRFLVL